MTEPLVLKNNRVFVLDQRFLPLRKKYLEIKSADDGFRAIRDMIVRGAPLIGVTAFYALAIEAKRGTKPLFKKAVKMASARPTAVNLMFAVKEFEELLLQRGGSPRFGEIALKAAVDFHKREIEATRRISENGEALFSKPSAVMTHCNAGALATTGFGTALGVISFAYKKGKIKEVFACETRPYFQGMRLTAFELKEANIPHKVVCDNTAGFLMKKGLIGAVVVGADRIASNGDTANKIGTFSLAVLCRHHEIPFYVAAPMSTVDFSIKDETGIPIEERDSKELFSLLKRNCSRKSQEALYYAFDITPHGLITAIITDKGVVSPVNASTMKRLLKAK